MQVNVTLNTRGPGTASYSVEYSPSGTSATVTVTMTPNSGHHLTRLYGYYTNFLSSGDHAKVAVDQSYSATVTRTWSVIVGVRSDDDSQTVKLCACFDNAGPDIGEYYSLSVVGVSMGGGSVDLDEDTFTNVPVGIKVSGVATATPDQGYRFVRWETGSGSTYTNNPHPWTFTGNEERDYTITFYAYFEEIPEYDYEVDSVPVAGGTVNGQTHLSGTVQDGTPLSLSAVPNVGYSFVGYYYWDDDRKEYRLLSSSRNYTISIRKNWDIEARFTNVLGRTFTVKFEPPSAWHGSHGTMTLSVEDPPQSHSFTEDGICELFPKATGQIITVTASFAPAEGCRFVEFRDRGYKRKYNPAPRLAFFPSDDTTITVVAACDKLMYHDPDPDDRLLRSSKSGDRGLVYCG